MVYTGTEQGCTRKLCTFYLGVSTGAAAFCEGTCCCRLPAGAELGRSSFVEASCVPLHTHKVCFEKGVVRGQNRTLFWTYHHDGSFFLVQMVRYTLYELASRKTDSSIVPNTQI